MVNFWKLQYGFRILFRIFTFFPPKANNCSLIFWIRSWKQTKTRNRSLQWISFKKEGILSLSGRNSHSGSAAVVSQLWAAWMWPPTCRLPAGKQAELCSADYNGTNDMDPDLQNIFFLFMNMNRFVPFWIEEEQTQKFTKL